MTRVQRALITGAGRGIGLEFTRQWLAGGREVFALARDPKRSSGLASLARDFPSKLHAFPCDVADDASVEAAAASVGRASEGIDLLVNNAAIYGSRGGNLRDLDLEEVRRVLEVNTLGPIRVTRAFLPLLKKGHAARVVHLTSLMGSIADNGSGGTWAYRISKAALNMAARNMALELAGDRIPCVVIHPGWVKTDMGGPAAPLQVDASVASMIRSIDAATIEISGTFIDRDSKPMPW
jgi:NAD(P)-dependent dehydrogenase (short-subunit alcohol dehydrogenase family)